MSGWRTRPRTAPAPLHIKQYIIKNNKEFGYKALNNKEFLTAFIVLCNVYQARPHTHLHQMILPVQRSARTHVFGGAAARVRESQCEQEHSARLQHAAQLEQRGEQVAPLCAIRHDKRSEPQNPFFVVAINARLKTSNDCI